MASFPILGVAGFLTEWIINPNSLSNVVGASGTIAALMGAYLPLFPSARVRMIAFFGIFFKRFTLPAWVFLPYWLSLQLVSLVIGRDDEIAYGVHVGSFTLGLIAAIIWKTSYLGADEALQVFVTEQFSKKG